MTQPPADRALDLFAGAGGWDLAAQALGLHADGVEIMTEARATRDAAGLSTIWDDVWTIPLALVFWLYAGLITSPPCQTFSGAGNGSGRKALGDVLRVIPHVKNVGRGRLRKIGRAFGDDRTALVLSPLWYALHTPGLRWLAWEQVPVVLPVWEACADELRRHGWNVWVGYVYSEQHGVPQTRKRAILIASRDHKVGPPKATHSRYYSRAPHRLDPGVGKWVSMSDALGFGLGARPAPTITGGGGDKQTGGAEPIPDWSDRPAGRKGCVRTIDEPAPTVVGAMDNGNYRWVVAAGVTGAGAPRPVGEPAPTVTGKGTMYGIEDLETYAGPEALRWRPVPAIEGETLEDCTWVHDRPSPTVVGSFRPDVVAKPGYRKPGDPPRQKTPGSVRVTVAEAGILQSFPPDHPWQGSQGKQYLQAGNAVPPLMALAILSEAIGLNAREAAPATVLRAAYDKDDAPLFVA